MGKNSLLKWALLLLAATAVLAPVRPAVAMTAEQYFEDGNRLFRDDLYWAALLRYRQAADEGLDTPILHYNTGVAHYRAMQHIRAREALLKASRDPSLRVASHYNLGCIAAEEARGVLGDDPAAAVADQRREAYRVVGCWRRQAPHAATCFAGRR